VASSPTPASPAALAWWELENEPDPVLKQQVEDSHRRFWDVRGRAFLDLDTSRLTEVETGPAPERDEAAIRDLKAQGRAQKLEVEHASRVAFASNDEAVMYDEYTSRSVFIDIVSN
jgi:hypothetical protein